MIKQIVTIAITVLLSFHVSAKEVAGITIPEKIKISGSDKVLMLNGAGIRSKFFFDIYIGALYLEQLTGEAKNAVVLPGVKRVTMHFLYKEVEKEKLIEGWNDGFKNNNEATQLKTLQVRLEKFNSFFQTAYKGDVINLDYLPGVGTHMYLNNQLKGIIAGDDFYRALLKVWLGDEPADSGLKDAMLGE